MSKPDNHIAVYYDAQCASCQKDQAWFERVAPGKIRWADLHQHQAELRAQGIDPAYALQSLHIRLPDGVIIHDIEAYEALFALVWWLRPLNWVLGIPIIKRWARHRYHTWVNTRIAETGACVLPENQRHP